MCLNNLLFSYFLIIYVYRHFVAKNCNKNICKYNKIYLHNLGLIKLVIIS